MRKSVQCCRFLQSDNAISKCLKNNGGASRDRTDDLIVANDALSQLSYSPLGRYFLRCTNYFSSDSEPRQNATLYFSPTRPETQKNYLDELHLAASNRHEHDSLIRVGPSM